jgi:predicted component of type VI protein secretion system
LCVILAAGLSACVSTCQREPEAAQLCLQIEASAQLGMYENEPHSVLLVLFPLENDTAFKEANPADLLKGKPLPGSTGPGVPVPMAPKETRELRDLVDARTRFVGLVADFYGGPQTALVEIGCKSKQQPRRLVLLADRVETDAEVGSR